MAGNMVGSKKETPYSNMEKVDSIPSRLQKPIAQGVLAARRNSIVTLRLLNGNIAENVRLTKGIIYDVEFREVLKIFPTLKQAELWVFYLPTEVKGVQYV